jgi:ubiquinone/menaquinone biosynthesis C-methylase UbiE
MLECAHWVFEMNQEIEDIAARYQRRSLIPTDRYSRLNQVVNLTVQERQRALIRLFSQMGLKSLADVSVLEVGCGSGANLLELIEFGANPALLVGNELLADRLTAASVRLPASVRLLAGDASQLDLPTASFDIVYQSTVFSSILDNGLQASLAQRMWELVKPGGGVLWYDFTYNNPNNPDVRGVPVSRLNDLFPMAKVNVQKVTLAPPIARRVVPLSPYFYGLLNILPFLRTHVLCYLEKE